MAMTVRNHDFVVSQQGPTRTGGEANLISLPDHWALSPNDLLVKRERVLCMGFLLGSPIDQLHHTITSTYATTYTLESPVVIVLILWNLYPFLQKMLSLGPSHCLSKPVTKLD